MSAAPSAPPAKTSALAPFRVKSFRFQWPADLMTSWAQEMELILLAWFILVETQSVVMLTMFGALTYLGTLMAPVLGVTGQRVGNKKTYCALRLAYTVTALFTMSLALGGVLAPWHVFVIGAILSVVRPSDLVLRYAMLGETMPASNIMGAASVSRTTQDSARIFGALSGAALAAWLGMANAYMAIAVFYAGALLLSLRVTGRDGSTENRPSSTLHDLSNGMVYVWQTPHLLAAMAVAFLVNLCAFPLTNGLLPFVAKDVYLSDQRGLSYLAASFAFGALVGSLILTRIGYKLPTARTMIVFCAIWYVMTLIFAQMPGFTGGIPMLILAGCAQSMSMVPLSAMLLRTTREGFRGHVMGVRTLMIYGVPVGLLVSGPLLANVGYRATATLYCVFGLICTAAIGWYWREHIWRMDAQGNKR
ncbi:MAG: MFS transporter [Betaproteobacteria bacterium]|nr:MFS transporter [Betaproteobacteria bacterium]